MKPKEGYKMMRRLFNKRTYIVLGILCCIFMWLQFGTESYAFTRTTGEVTGSSVKVRASASTDAEVVASVRAGDELDVTDAVNGSDGKVWYKILVSANEYGYIRSDFVTLEGGAQAPSTDTPTVTTPTTTTPTTTTPTTTVEPSEVTPMDPQNGHTNTNNVKVRQQASTSSTEVDRLNQDQVFSITGTAQGADSKVWYQVSYVDNGTSMSGFIRSDLVTVMEDETQEEPQGNGEEVIQVEDEFEQEEPSVPTPDTNYEAVYTTDENGDYIWYLYDRTAGQRYKVDQLLQLDKQSQEELDELSSANFGLKIGLIISICLLIMLVVAVVFYLLKMKEEEETTTYRKPAQGAGNMRSQATTRSQTVTRPQTTVRNQGQQTTRTQSGARPQNATQTRNQSAQPVKTQGAQSSQSATRTQNSAATQQTAKVSGQGAPAQQKTSWKAKNFLDDNDEFEFGFLDFDEDDE